MPGDARGQRIRGRQVLRPVQERSLERGVSLDLERPGTPIQAEQPRRRWKRFFGSRGICECFERLGRPWSGGADAAPPPYSDRLVQFGEIVDLLADRAQLKRTTVIDAFRLAVADGWFGRDEERGRLNTGRGTITQLIDLDRGSELSVPRGQYFLRPTGLEVAMAPEHRLHLLRARRLVWVSWAAAEGWPLPPRYDSTLLIQGEAGTQFAKVASKSGLPLNKSVPTEKRPLSRPSDAAVKAAVKNLGNPVEGGLIALCENVKNRPGLAHATRGQVKNAREAQFGKPEMGRPRKSRD